MNKKRETIPAYEEESAFPSHEDIAAKADDLENTEWEMWFVNDGSTDKTENEAIDPNEGDSRVHPISLRKNFETSAARQAGFHQADGDLIFSMEAA